MEDLYPSTGGGDDLPEIPESVAPRVKTPKQGGVDVPGVVDDELENLGYPEQSRLAILGNVGRENSWNSSTVFGGHNDPANGARNRGIISWQGDRGKAANDWMGGDWSPTEANVRKQVQFMDDEMRTKYPDVYKTVRDPDAPTPDVSRRLRDYINYSTARQYNSPDSEYDVAANRKWAETASARGLGRLPDVPADLGGEKLPDIPDSIGAKMPPQVPGNTPPPTNPTGVPLTVAQPDIVGNLTQQHNQLVTDLSNAKSPGEKNVIQLSIAKLEREIAWEKQNPQTPPAPAAAAPGTQPDISNRLEKLNDGQGNEYDLDPEQNGVAGGTRYWRTIDGKKVPFIINGTQISREDPDWLRGATAPTTQLPAGLQDEYNRALQQFGVKDTEEFRNKFLAGFDNQDLDFAKSYFTAPDTTPAAQLPGQKKVLRKGSVLPVTQPTTAAAPSESQPQQAVPGQATQSVQSEFEPADTAAAKLQQRTASFLFGGAQNFTSDKTYSAPPDFSDLHRDLMTQAYGPQWDEAFQAYRRLTGSLPVEFNTDAMAVYQKDPGHYFDQKTGKISKVNTPVYAGVKSIVDAYAAGGGDAVRQVLEQNAPWTLKDHPQQMAQEQASRDAAQEQYSEGTLRQQLKNPTASDVIDQGVSGGLSRAAGLFSNPFSQLYRDTQDIKTQFSNLWGGQDERIDKALADLRESGGGSRTPLTDALNQRRELADMSAPEFAGRLVADAGRSFIKSTISDSLKGVDFLDSLNEKYNPEMAILPDAMKPSLRNLGNGLAYMIAYATNPDKVKDFQFVKSSDDTDKKLFYSIGKNLDQALGEDRLVGSTLSGKLASGFGSALGFVALGMVAPELSLETKLGHFSLTGAGLGSLQMAGSGYEQARAAGFTGSKADLYGAISGANGALMGYGIGASVSRAIEKASLKQTFVRGLFDYAQQAGKSALRGGSQFSLLGFVQSTIGQSVMATMKDEEPSAYKRVMNLITRLPDEAQKNLGEMPSAFLTGGLFEGGMSTIAGHAQEGPRVDLDNNLVELDGVRYKFSDDTKPAVAEWAKQLEQVDGLQQQIDQLRDKARTAKTYTEKKILIEKARDLGDQVTVGAGLEQRFLEKIQSDLTPANEPKTKNTDLSIAPKEETVASTSTLDRDQIEEMRSRELESIGEAKAAPWRKTLGLTDADAVQYNTLQAIPNGEVQGTKLAPDRAAAEKEINSRYDGLLDRADSTLEDLPEQEEPVTYHEPDENGRSQFFHKQEGIVQESEDQKGVPAGKIRVDVIEGPNKDKQLIIKRPDGNGRGNNFATPIAKGLGFGQKEEPRAENVASSEEPKEAQPATPDGFRTGSALWKTEDAEEPVEVTGYAGEQDGKHMVTVDGREEPVPLDQLEYPPAPKVQVRPGRIVDIKGGGKGRVAEIRKNKAGDGYTLIVDHEPKTVDGTTVYDKRSYFKPEDLSVGGYEITAPEAKEPKAGKQAPEAPTITGKGESPDESLKTAQPRISIGDAEIEKYTSPVKTQKLTTQAGTSLHVTPIVVDENDIVTSFKPGFPKELQPRKQDRDASRLRIERYKQELDPERLGDNFDPGLGRPILVAAKVEGKQKYFAITANHRLAAIDRIYDANLPKREEYENFVREQGQRADVAMDGVPERPVYAAVINDPSKLDLVKFAEEANEGTNRMGAAEQATVDARKLNSAFLELFKPDDAGFFNNNANADFIRKFHEYIVPELQQGDFLTEDGKLSQAGVIRVRNAIFAKAFGGSQEGVNALAKLAEDPSDNARNITSGLVRSVGGLAQLKARGEEDPRFEHLDITDDIAKAVAKFVTLRSKGQSVDTYLQEVTLPGVPGLDVRQKRLVQILDEFQRSQTKIAGVFHNYVAAVDAIGNPDQMNMFTGGTVDVGEFRPEELLRAAVESVEEGVYAKLETTHLFDSSQGGEGEPRESPAAEKLPTRPEPRAEPGQQNGSQDVPAAGAEDLGALFDAEVPPASTDEDAAYKAWLASHPGRPDSPASRNIFESQQRNAREDAERRETEASPQYRRDPYGFTPGEVVEKKDGDRGEILSRMEENPANGYFEQYTMRNERTGAVEAVKSNDINGIAGPREPVEKPETHDYSSTQVDLSPDAADGIRDYARFTIDPKDLYEPEGGIEENPHVSVKYGIHSEDPAEVQKLLAGEKGVNATLGPVEVFYGDETGNPYDVVMVRVKSRDLNRLNKKISAGTDVTDTFPTYEPHITLAYVKAGTGDKYAGDGYFEGNEVSFDNVHFSSKDGSVTAIPLETTPKEEVPTTIGEQLELGRRRAALEEGDDFDFDEVDDRPAQAQPKTQPEQSVSPPAIAAEANQAIAAEASRGKDTSQTSNEESAPDINARETITGSDGNLFDLGGRDEEGLFAAGGPKPVEAEPAPVDEKQKKLEELEAKRKEKEYADVSNVFGPDNADAITQVLGQEGTTPTAHAAARELVRQKGSINDLHDPVEGAEFADDLTGDVLDAINNAAEAELRGMPFDDFANNNTVPGVEPLSDRGRRLYDAIANGKFSDELKKAIEDTKLEADVGEKAQQQNALVDAIDQYVVKTAGDSQPIRRKTLALTKGDWFVNDENELGYIDHVDPDGTVHYEIEHSPDDDAIGEYTVGAQNFREEHGFRVTIPEGGTTDAEHAGDNLEPDSESPTAGLEVRPDDVSSERAEEGRSVREDASNAPSQRIEPGSEQSLFGDSSAPEGTESDRRGPGAERRPEPAVDRERAGGDELPQEGSANDQQAAVEPGRDLVHPAAVADEDLGALFDEIVPPSPPAPKTLDKIFDETPADQRPANSLFMGQEEPASAPKTEYLNKQQSVDNSDVILAVAPNDQAEILRGRGIAVAALPSRALSHLALKAKELGLSDKTHTIYQYDKKNGKVLYEYSIDKNLPKEPGHPLKPGMRVTLARDFDYLKAGETYLIDHVGQRAGTAYFKNERRGSGTYLNARDIRGAIENGTMKVLPKDRVSTDTLRTDTLPAEPKPTAAEKIQEATDSAKKGLEDTISGLAKLFGDDRFKGSGFPSFDEDTYQQAKPLFLSAFEHFKDAAGSAAEAMKLLIGELRKRGYSDDMLRNMKPYIMRFSTDVRDGIVRTSENQETAPIELVDKPESRSAQNKLEQQKNAESTAVKLNDLDNIAETLPVLFKEQHQDVHFVEHALTNMPDRETTGAMITNGTGTGKTFSGLGVVKRFAKRGENNILILSPSQEIINGWTAAGRNLNLDIRQLAHTEDNGQDGIVATTYANLQQNPSLIKRKWDLIVPDEAHNLMSNQQGELTSFAQGLRAITMHKRGEWDYARQAAIKEILTRDELDRDIEQQKAVAESLEGNPQTRAEAKALRGTIAEMSKQLSGVNDRIKAIQDQARGEWKDRRANEKQSKVLFLSATPFAYHSSIEYAEGFLFDYDEGKTPDDELGRMRLYNEPNNQQAFMVEHFGYRMRYNKLTKPDANVDQGLMERQFNTYLKQQKVLSGRMLGIDKDYSRDFILAHDAVGQKIDEGINYVDEGENGRFRPLAEHVRKNFTYLNRTLLLEAMKAKAAVPLIQQHLALGRKVVVFHDYNVGGGFQPFEIQAPRQQVTYNFDGSTVTVSLHDLYEQFKASRPDLMQMDFSGYKRPIDAFREAFPDDGAHKMVELNGTQTKRENQNAIDLFNLDGSGVNVILVQSAKGQAGVSLHDVTGNHQRATINLGLPVRPVTAIQEEGRTYRVGNQSDAIQQYLNTGTNWERDAFASKMAERAGTAENMSLGEDARSLRESMIDSFLNPIEDYQAHAGEGKGGKEKDRLRNAAISAWDRAKTYYFANLKKTAANKAREGVDYYATPEPIGLKMVQFADMKAGESALEPSAGHGAIARSFPEDTRNTFVEPSADLLSRLRLHAPNTTSNRFESHPFEDLDTAANKYDTIVMNPPYGSGGKTAVDHLAKAFEHLRDGGRVVALLPEGGSTDKRLEKLLYESERPAPVLEGFTNTSNQRRNIHEGDTVVFADGGKLYNVTRAMRNGGRGLVMTGEDENGTAKIMREDWPNDAVVDVVKGPRVVRGLDDIYQRAEINLPAATFSRAGTAVRTRILVFDKVSSPDAARNLESVRKDYSGAENIKDLFDGIEHYEVPDRVASATNNPVFDGVAADHAEYDAADSRFEKNEFDHTTKGDRIYVAKLKEFSDDFKDLKAAAKSHDGYYSSYKRDGAIPGFHFKTPDARDAFVRENDLATDAGATGEDPDLYSINSEEQDRRKAVSLLRDLELPEILPTATWSRQGDRIKMNLMGAEILRRAIEQDDINRGRRKYGEDATPSFMGYFADPRRMTFMPTVLHGAAEEMRKAGYTAEADKVQALVNDIDAARKVGLDKTAVFYVQDSKLPQELFHQFSYGGALEKALTRRHARPGGLDAHPAMAIAREAFFDHQPEYQRMSPGDRKAVVREELAAWIAEGDPESLKQLGLADHEDLANEYLLDFFESYADKVYSDAKREGKSEEDAQALADHALTRFSEIDYAKDAVQHALEVPRLTVEGQPRNSRSGDTGDTQAEDAAGEAGGAEEGKVGAAAATFALEPREFATRRNLPGDASELGVKGEKKLASLPETQRTAGIAADDQLYTVFGDKAAQVQANKLIEENGVAGAIRIIENEQNPDVHHAIASFAIQRMLYDEAERIRDTNPKQAADLTKLALNMGSTQAMRMTKAGRFIRAAGVIMKTVPGVMATAKRLYEEKHGAGAEIPADVMDRIQQTATAGEVALGEHESLSKQIDSLKRELASVRSALAGDGNLRKISPRTLASRKRLVTEVKNNHADDVRQALERLRQRALVKQTFGITKELEDASLFSIYDQNDLPKNVLTDFAHVGAMMMTDGLAKPDMMRPADFDEHMVSMFGESVTPHLDAIHRESLRLRNEWLADMMKAKDVKSIVKQFGENLSPEEIESILLDRKDELKRRATIMQLHRLRAERGTAPEDLTQLEAIIAKQNVSKEAAIAAGELARKKPTATELYNTLEALGIKGADAREALRQGTETLERSRLILARQKSENEAALRERMDGIKDDLDQLDKARLESKARVRASQSSLAKELRRISTGDVKYYGKTALEALNTTRSVMVLGPAHLFRHGGWFLISRPKQQRAMFSAMWDTFSRHFDSVGFEKVKEELEADPHVPLAIASGIDFSTVGKHGNDSLTAGEEETRNNIFKMMSNWTEGTAAHKVNPARAANAVLRMSDQQYMTALDAQRLAAFSSSADELAARGLTFEQNPKEFRALGEYINDAVGRSSVGNERVANLLMNLPLFAPRFTASRFKLLYKTTVGLPFLPPATRSIVMRDAGKFYGAIAAAMLLARMAGASVSLDPEDADFLKIHFGDHHLDPLLGMQQPLRTMLRMTIATGRKALGSDDSLGMFRDSYKDDKIDEFRHDMGVNSESIPVQFLRGHLSPLAGIGVDYAEGQDMLGNPFSWKHELLDKATPINARDIIEAGENDGVSGLAIGGPLSFTGGYLNYPTAPERPHTAAEKLATKLNSLRMPDREEDDADKATDSKLSLLKADVRSGQLAQADFINQIRGMASSGEITSKRAVSLINGSDDTYFEAKVKRMPTPMLDAVRKVSNADERELIDQILGARQQKSAAQRPPKPLPTTAKPETYQRRPAAAQ